MRDVSWGFIYEELCLREEERATVARGAILAVNTEVVAADERLAACTDGRAAVILTELHGLIHPTVAVTEVGRLRVTQMEAQAFNRAVTDRD